ncbi:unnamed protein product [Miscanthus lutarioriparius]|uniref:FRIGIDA-like protein n=1 Tax=Miscanthus lutarioriparius TaxID=422564 RepID=A0A811N0D4_9POAL|nr:unnamed protein product [Miscanthus lutarioriparius]
MQSGSAAPQPTPNSLPPLPVPTQPAKAMATQAELEAAVAALSDKKRRLREAFDRLVACSPVPVPFRWEDLDAHLASIAASFGFRHLDSTHADAIAGAAAVAVAAAADARGPTTAAHHVHHLDKEGQDRERRVGRGAPEEGQGSSNAAEAEEAWNASSHQERGEEDGKVREASSARPDREANEAGSILGVETVPIEAAPEQLDDEKEEDAMGALVASPHQRDDDIEMLEEEEEEAVNANADRERREDEAEEGEWLQHPHDAGGGETSALTRAVAAACANMDPSALVDALCLSGRSSLRSFLPALLGAPDPHALLVRAVGGFLDLASAGPGRDASEWWANCVALIECAPRLAAPSADALAQAKRLAGHWKEMVVAGPAGAGGRDIGGMAGWGLLTFIVSYNIVPEFDADGIVRLFDNIAPQVKDSCVELCKRLGLIGKMTDSINHFIENGQPLDAIRLAHTFSLTDKYPPLTIMNDYIENSKKTAEDILSKESYTLESLNQAMAKKVDALIFSWSAIDGCDIDSVQRKSIKEEITQLLHKYANKQQNLAGVSASISSSHQHQNFQEEYQQRPQMRLVEQQKQQRNPHGLQPKPGEKLHQQQKPQETQHRHIQNQQELPEPEMWQNRKRRGQNKKNRKRKQRRQKLQQQNKRPRLPPYVRPGINDNQHEEPFSGIRRAPFAACTTPIPRYFWSCDDRSQHHVPVFRR